MKFIDLRINKYFKILNYDGKTGKCNVLVNIKIPPVKTDDFKIYNSYCLTTKRYMFVNPYRDIKPMFK